MSFDKIEVDSHFDPEEMERFGLDYRNPEDREKWVRTEPITSENPDIVNQLLSLYTEIHPVEE